MPKYYNKQKNKAKKAVVLFDSIDTVDSVELAKELIAHGLNPKKTYFIIDQIYTNIYNVAIKLYIQPKDLRLIN